MRISHILEKYGDFWPIAFGVVFTNNPQEQAYEQHEADKIRIKKLTDDVEGKSYPGRLFPIPETEKTQSLRKSLLYAPLLYLVSYYDVFSLLLHRVDLGGKSSSHPRRRLCEPWSNVRPMVADLWSGGILILTLLYKVRNRPALLLVAQFYFAV